MSSIAIEAARLMDALPEADKVLPENIDLSAYKLSVSGSEEGIRARSATLMMEEVVEGEVVKTDKHTSVRYKSFYGTDRYFYGIADKQFKPGDKVRIIIVKAEEE